jgi:ubiquinone/menaquinone biosynthesis C-methylase UbiE
MKTYYIGKYAQFYNQRWKSFSAHTLANTCSAIDFVRLKDAAVGRGYPLRILDVGCGTGLLLLSLAARLPQAELYGVDASQDMLDQARWLMKDHPHVRLVQGTVTGGEAARLHYEPAFFDLITCTNVFHYFKDPVKVLSSLAVLLLPQGQLVLEDYTRRSFPFPWRLCEWIIRCIDPQHVWAYTLAEAQAQCQLAKLQIIMAKKFSIDFLWRGWVITSQNELERSSSTDSNHFIPR